MTEEMKKKRDELAESYGGYTFDHGSKVNGFIKGFDAAYKLMEAELASVREGFSTYRKDSSATVLKLEAEIAELNKEVNRLHEKYDFQLLVKREEILKSRIEKLRAALNIYATAEYVDVKSRDRDQNGEEILVTDDNGEIARAALKEDEGEG